MCGIFSVAFYNKVDDESFKDIINLSNNALAHIDHRGPDNKDIIGIENKVILGHTRLSINGLIPEFNQPYPLISDSKKINKNVSKIIYNGEIFNFKELDNNSKCDTQVLFDILEDSNLEKSKIFDALQNLNGMWSFIYYKDNKFVVSRDRFGEKPLFYFKNEDFIVFSSEIYPIIFFLKKYLNYFDFEDIKEYPCSSYSLLNINSPISNIEFIKYFGDKVNEVYGKTLSFKKTFSRAVELRLISDVPLAFTLSGGLDSSAVIAQASKFIEPHKLTAYCASPEFGFSELSWAEKAANEIGCNLRVVSYDPEDYIKAFKYVQKKFPKDIRSPSSVVHFLVFKKIKEDGYKVVLEGQGADEMFGGYLHSEVRYYLHCLIFLKFKKLKKISKRIFVKTKLSEIWLLFLSEFLRFKWVSMNFEDVKRNVYNDPLPSLVKYGDLASMLNSIESRNPFLDHRLYEYASTQNDSRRFEIHDSKKDIRELLSDYSIYSIANRPDKKGYELPWESLISYVVERNDFPKFFESLKMARLYKKPYLGVIYHYVVMNHKKLFGAKRSFIAYFKYRVMFGWEKGIGI